MLVIIDNYDSFTYNLVQYFGELGADLEVYRNDQITPAEILAKGADHIVISPGPCTPNEAGISMDVIETLGESIPILGVCLGHQSIGQIFGGNVIRASKVMHGKISHITHNGDDLFKDVPSPFEATRYHSLIVERETLPDCLEVTAETEDGIIMALRHKTFPIRGVQFHPESILSPHGKTMLKNFLNTRKA